VRLLPGRTERRSPLRVELDVLARAVGGAMLFGMPLLFTMEMWWIGEHIARIPLLAFLGVAFLLNVALAHLSGFRHERATIAHDLAQAVEAMAVGIVVSVAVLATLNRIHGEVSAETMFGMVAVQVIPLSLGAMVANLVFAPDSDRVHGEGGPSGSPLREFMSDVGATFAGAIFVGFAIAPTEEIPMLASGLGSANLVALVALSLLAGYLIVFASGFDPSHRGSHSGGLFQRPISETVLAFLVSLLAAFVMLTGFGQLSVDDPPLAIATKLLVLAVPASIGGAAGRVVV
jgi:putative integral membrane protein (TIGR02587 family)